MAQLKTLNDLLAHEIQVMYSAENLLLAGIPRMIQHTENQMLKDAFLIHVNETKQQVERLKQAADILEIDPDGDGNPGMKGLIAEGEKVMHKDAEPEVLDATLIAGAQKIEHYEIAGYGTIVALAKQLGHQDLAELFQLSLDEEKKTDALLTQLAVRSVNPRAEEV